ncbi:MAG: hypothetical protein ABH816_00775 [Candidatus Levyibacteriota bacterium]
MRILKEVFNMAFSRKQELHTNYDCILNSNTKEVLKRVDKRIKEIEIWPTPCSQIHRNFSEAFRMESWQANSIYELVRSLGIIEFERKRHGRRDRLYATQDMIRALAVYHSVWKTDPREGVIEARRVLNSHPLAELFHDPKPLAQKGNASRVKERKISKKLPEKFGKRPLPKDSASTQPQTIIFARDKGGRVVPHGIEDAKKMVDEEVIRRENAIEEMSKITDEQLEVVRTWDEQRLSELADLVAKREVVNSVDCNRDKIPVFVAEVIMFIFKVQKQQLEEFEAEMDLVIYFHFKEAVILCRDCLKKYPDVDLAKLFNIMKKRAEAASAPKAPQ